VEAKLDAILAVAHNLLIKMDGSHPLVPKRKLTASQMQRGKIYKRPDSTPQTVATELMRPTQDASPLRQHFQQPAIFVANEGMKKKSEIISAIRIDPKLASMFEFETSAITPGKDTNMN
jgi:hypothetical protein